MEIDFASPSGPRDWRRAPNMARLLKTITGQHKEFRGVLARMAEYCRALTALPLDAHDPARPTLPFWLNPWMPPLDGMTIFGLIAEREPRRYIEIGSGYSTMYARAAIDMFGLATQIVSIDPTPRAEIDALCHQVIRKRCEDVELDFWLGLGPDDMMFVDNSHRSFMNSDVTCFFSDILGCLKPGSVYGLHDIFLPEDYPKDFKDRFYNEQYVFMAYLLGGADGDRILLPNAYLSKQPALLQPLKESIASVAGGNLWLHGGAFWMQRGNGVKAR